MRQTLYDAMPMPTRRSLHLRCAEYLEDQARTASMSWVFELAHHYTQGLDQRLAFDYLCLAGDVSEQRNADAQALRYWQQAVEALGAWGWEGLADKEFALLLKVGRNGFILSPKEAIEAFERVLPMINEQMGTPEAALAMRLEVLTLLGNAYGFYGAPKKGLEMVEQALLLCPPEPATVRAAIQTVQATNLMTAGRFDEMSAISKQAAAVLMRPELEGPPMVNGARVGVAAFQNAVCFQGVRPDEKLAEYAYWASAQIGDELPITIRQFFGIWNAWTGRHDEAIQYIEEVTQIARRIGSPPYPWVLYLRPYILMQRGEPMEALAQIDAAIQYDHLHNAEMTRLMVSVLQGQALLALGHHKAAHMVLTTTMARGRTTGMYLVVIQALLALGEVELSLGDPVRAERFWREAHELSSRGVARNPLHQAIAARLMAEGALAGGDHARASALVAEALAIVSAPEQDNWIELAHNHRVQGEVLLAQGRRDDAIKALQKAGDMYHRVKNPDRLHHVIQRLEEASKQELPKEAKEMPVEARWNFMGGLLR
jgi:tetratricopeptide (TPR) repeat protein